MDSQVIANEFNLHFEKLAQIISTNQSNDKEILYNQYKMVLCKENMSLS